MVKIPVFEVVGAILDELRGSSWSLDRGFFSRSRLHDDFLRSIKMAPATTNAKSDPCVWGHTNRMICLADYQFVVFVKFCTAISSGNAQGGLDDREELSELERITLQFDFSCLQIYLNRPIFWSSCCYGTHTLLLWTLAFFCCVFYHL